MKHRISYSIRPKDPGDEKKNRINEEQAIPSFSLDEFKRYPGKETPRKPNDLLKRLAVIGGGITVGLVFGYALLQTFISPNDMNQTGPTGQISQPAMSSQVQTNVKEMSISLNAINVFLVQAGVFTTQESANKKASEFKNKQQPAEISQEDGKFIVYVGIASSRDEALSIAQFYRSEKVPVIIKEKQIPTDAFTVQIPFTTSQETINQLNTMSATEVELFKLLTVNASSGFSQTTTTGYSTDKITQVHDTFFKQGSTLLGLLPETKKTPLQNSLNEINEAVNAAKNNQLLELQGNLLRFYTKEKEFRSGKS